MTLTQLRSFKDIVTLGLIRRQNPFIMLGGALLFVGLVSASANHLYERQDAAPTATSTVKEVSSCHFHETVQ